MYFKKDTVVHIQSMTLSKQKIAGSGGASALCECTLMAVLHGCPSVMLTGGINSLIPEADNPSFTTRWSKSYTVHIWVCMCLTLQHELNV